MEDLKAEGLYRVVSDIIGSESVIDIRRMAMDVESGIDNVALKLTENEEELIRVGSRNEGFRFISSDYDLLHVRRGVRAVFSSFLGLVDETQQTILLADTDETKPGFALLRLISQTGVDEQVMKSLVKYGSGYYLRNISWIRSRYLGRRVPDFFVHGPCLSGTLASCENDFAECIKSDRLPPLVYNRLLRLYQNRKLSYHNLENICLKGCNFVAISSRRPVFEGLEWRISFSFAEKNIVQTFSHTQFLCYGLLKLFLKEAIETNAAIKGFICSYFMKTAIFWMSLDCSIHWTIDNFFFCFWKCLQLLMNWVVNDYCPNFFIPENNMFADKFTRTQHLTLLNHLSGLYQEGFPCLFRCPSIRDKLIEIIELPYILQSKPSNTSKSYLECTLIQETWNHKPIFLTDNTNPAILQYLEQQESVHQYRMIFINIWKHLVLSNTAFRIGSQGRNCLKTNSWHYRQCRAIIATLQACEDDATSNILYCAIHLYRLGRLKNVLRLINKTTKRLRHPFIMYPGYPDIERYAAAGGETRPIIDMMRTVVAFPVILDKDACIPELFLERVSIIFLGGDRRIVIPPIVCATFLGYLCHYKLGEFELANSVLQKLSTLLINGDKYHIVDQDRAISWDILGICQEMSGDFQGACHSYGESLQQDWCPSSPSAVELFTVEIR